MSSTSSPDTIFDDPVFEEQQPQTYPSLKQLWLLFPVILGLLVIVMICLGIYVGVTHGKADSANYLVGPLSALVYLLLAVFVYGQKKKQEPDFTFSFRMPSLPVMLLPIAIMPALTIAFIGVGTWFHVDIWATLMKDRSGYYPDNIFIANGCGLVYIFSEHLLHRGILLDGLLKRYRPSVAILNSTLFMGLLYMLPIIVCFYLLVNLLYNWMYHHTRSVLPGIWAGILHGIFFYVSMNSPWQKLIAEGNVLLTSSALVVLVISLLLLQRVLTKTNKSII
ncbi:CPBP family intramembrane metalloprotease [Chitinophaga sp. G-6-1-13]|uniref:CPBP family intramembrane metalloprotease n=1 Tax=Chitinophaga fulva TaxID=2728842 RepID=A0A848GCT0_9BACT|nr:CPBP family intramembrane glutamic endopeptidase [Chitinophaga fulva]NML35766.1 CPBP family intramembrane metalloprotease [Chitinophaga fulva]